MSSIAAYQNFVTPGARVAASGSDPIAQSTGADENQSASAISANDFLTLLVTELKNQDPTANSDPNQYVNQLVQVNSLEQLIQINETLTNSSTGGSTSAHSSGTMQSPVQYTVGLASAHPVAEPVSGGIHAGNLSIPAENPAAQRVAHSLGTKVART